jgi:transcriptional antiterminator NusG
MDYRHWYALFVMTGREDIVKHKLDLLLAKREDTTAAVFVPKRFIIDTNASGQTEVLRIMFPGYVLIGTAQVERVFALTRGLKDVNKFLRTNDEDKEFQEIALSEIMHIINLCDNDGIIRESMVTLDENGRIEVLSGPLKGEDGYITKFNRRLGRVAVDFLLGTERHELWLTVKVVEQEGTPGD